jgi:hypothetical protein
MFVTGSGWWVHGGVDQDVGTISGLWGLDKDVGGLDQDFDPDPWRDIICHNHYLFSIIIFPRIN